MTSIIKVNNIQNSSGTSALSINSNGVVNRSVIPAWRISLASSESRTATTQNVIGFDETTGNDFFLQGGCTLSSGTITVPVTGIYHVTANIRVDSIGSGFVTVRMRKNAQNAGATYTIYGTASVLYQTYTPSETFSLSANDTIQVTASSSVDTAWTVNGTSSFSGHLVG
ncbi:MAG: hypothetical protein Unbinned2189contig1000_29 [Prokaryotic dsDNA virus sp.]|mgnify:FL=1|nr:MAG: hypothetical protein Unbinned2189contig1000_29 [Prokaryotic dsDNA virus sp.]|tara:strand:- start:3681 stop:4187 length:507 start_codon:yes stop_codon:yes gene_type:complete